MKNLFILSGGVGNERDVSLSSSKSCAQVLRGVGVSFEELEIGKDKSFTHNGITMTEGDGLLFLQRENALVFQVIHGTYGEDGELVKKLEEHNISYIGSPSSVLEKTLNKWSAEKLLESEGVRTTSSVLVRRGDDVNVDEFSFPVIIKPNKEGSSVGVVKINKEEDLRAALDVSLQNFDEVLVQKCIKGREFTCGVMEINGREGALMPSEVVLEGGMLFDYHAKYFVNGLEITPAQVDEQMTKKIQDLALKTHTVTRCKDISRTDMMLDDDGELVVLEINTVPGMTDVSFIPAEMKASGYTLQQFIEGMLVKYDEAVK
jgi:D-alanine-D-alanine ligase